MTFAAKPDLLGQLNPALLQLSDDLLCRVLHPPALPDRASKFHQIALWKTLNLPLQLVDIAESVWSCDIKDPTRGLSMKIAAALDTAVHWVELNPRTTLAILAGVVVLGVLF